MNKPKPAIRISYCPGCKWLLRAGWMAQELLSTFEAELGEVTLAPAGSGVFQIHLDSQLIWCRKENGGFPEPKVLKQLVRDQIAPERDLGHIDR